MDLSQYQTDKISSGYLETYTPLFAPLRERPIALLELGVLGGESLRLWQDYFPFGTIVGLDQNVVHVTDATGRIHVYQGQQDDLELLTQLSTRHAPEGWDVVIDDASHLAAPTSRAFWHLFQHHLKAGGLYSIEDWGTGYWDDWPDGERPRWWRPAPTHTAGMVGLVKELVDEVGAKDLTRERFRQPPGRPSRFQSMVLAHGLCGVVKARTA